MLLGSRHTTQPAHAGVGGHHTTVRSQLFIAYPQTRVPAPSMLGPYADATGQTLNPCLIAPIRPPKIHELVPNISRSGPRNVTSDKSQ